MDKIVPNKNSRRHSTGNFTIEPATYKVLSRYLKDPLPSCHDNCKALGFDHPNEEPRPTPPVSQRSNDSATSSVNKIKKLFNRIPKPSTKDVKIINTTSLGKNKIKPQSIEPRKQDFSKSKIKSNGEINDPFYMKPSKTLTRRFSEIIIPSAGLGDVLISPPAGSLPRGSKKSESRKYSNSKPPSNSVKNTTKTPGNGKILKKVRIFKHESGLTKLRADQGSRNPKPVKPKEEVVQKKRDKTRSPTPMSDPSRNDEGEISLPSKKDVTPRSDSQNDARHGKISSPLEKDATPRSKSEDDEGKVLEHGQSGLISLPLKKDVTPQRNSQDNEGKAMKNVQVSLPLKEDVTPQSDGQNNEGKIAKNGQNGQISLPLKNIVTSQSDSQNNDGKIEKNGQNEQISLPLKNDVTPQSDSQNNDGKIAKNSQSGQISPPLQKDETPQSNSRNNEGKISANDQKGQVSLPSGVEKTEKPRRVGRLVKESEDSVKPHDGKANKRHSGLNNVIEETASKLIETRKSKVKALVGAFEMISTMD